MKSSRALVLSVAAGVIVLDRITKMWATANLTEEVSQPFIGDFLKFHLIFNPGAAFSMFTNTTWIFAIFATIASIAIVWYAPKLKTRAYAVAAGGILAGALGNLIDRCINDPGFPNGHVTDFLELPYWPIFNIADSSIVIAVTSIIIMLFLGFNPDGSREKKRHG